MIEALKRIWGHKELRNKILFTLAIIAVFRFFAHLPLPGVDRAALKNLFASNALLGLLSVFSGGAMENFSVVSLGLGPYINSSIIFQLLTFGFGTVFYIRIRERNQGRALLVVDNLRVYMLGRAKDRKPRSFCRPNHSAADTRSSSLPLSFMADHFSHYAVAPCTVLAAFPGLRRTTSSL